MFRGVTRVKHGNWLWSTPYNILPHLLQMPWTNIHSTWSGDTFIFVDTPRICYQRGTTQGTLHCKRPSLSWISSKPGWSRGQIMFCIDESMILYKGKCITFVQVSLWGQDWVSWVWRRKCSNCRQDHALGLETTWYTCKREIMQISKSLYWIVDELLAKPLKWGQMSLSLADGLASPWFQIWQPLLQKSNGNSLAVIPNLRPISRFLRLPPYYDVQRPLIQPPPLSHNG